MNFDFSSKKDNFKKYKEIESELIYESSYDVEPVISILIPTFKRPHLLKVAVDSAVNLSGNTKYEIIIVDNDCEKEHSLEIINTLKKYKNSKIRYYINEKNIGMYGNWNRCIELSSSECFTILNDDDVLSSSWLEVMIQELRPNSFLGCRSIKFSTPKELAETVPSNDISCREKSLDNLKINDLFIGLWTNGSLGSIFNKKNVMHLGGFDDEMFPMSDYYFYSLYCNFYGGNILKNELAYFRWSENESLNLNTLKQQISSNYEFRQYLIKNRYVSGKLRYNFIAKALQAKMIINAKKINDEICIKSVIKENDLSFASVCLLRCVPFFLLRHLVK